MCISFLCSYKESKLKMLLFALGFNGLFGESDCLGRNGKYTIKLCPLGAMALPTSVKTDDSLLCLRGGDLGETR